MEDVGDHAVFSEMCEKMRLKEDDDDRTMLSKKLSYVLRHGAKQLDLEIDDGGYVCVSGLLACVELFGGVQLEALMEVVDQSNKDKQRYETVKRDDGEVLIRATGKHTMQGLEKARPKKVQRRPGGKEEASRGQRVQLSEEDFCEKWRLDRHARQRLSALPPASRQLVMKRFSPGPQVPATDFPKVFVAFCKRFVEKDGVGGHEDVEEQSSPSGSRGSPSSASPIGGKSGKATKGKTKKSAKRGTEAIAEETSESSPVHSAGLVLEDSSPYANNYPSPGSTPRSDLDNLDALGVPGMMSPMRLLHMAPVPSQNPPLTAHALPAQPQSPMGSPMSPAMDSPQLSTSPQRPPRAPPPTTYAPGAMPTADASRTWSTFVPPPPMHAPQVHGFVMEAGTRQVCGGYEEVPQRPPGQWATVPSGYRNVQVHSPSTLSTEPQPRQRQPVSVGYQTGANSYGYAEARTADAGYGNRFGGSCSYSPGPLQHEYQNLQRQSGGNGQIAYTAQAEPMLFRAVDPHARHREAYPGGVTGAGACY